jgi:hypothetical protein
VIDGWSYQEIAYDNFALWQYFVKLASQEGDSSRGVSDGDSVTTPITDLVNTYLVACPALYTAVDGLDERITPPGMNPQWDRSMKALIKTTG